MTSTGNAIVYLYDAFGSPVGFCYRTADYAANQWDRYFYGRNAQGDIVFIYSSTGTILAEYTYDAWGNFTVEYSNGGADTTAIYNNLTYRGYVYDSDLGLYALTTRYYDSNIGRFINADTVDALIATPNSLTDKNLYAYCDNNPVMRVDQGGEFWLFAIVATAIVSAVVNVVSAVIEETVSDDEKPNYTRIVASGAIGLVEGAASALCPAAAPFISAAANAADTLVDNLIDEDNDHKVTGEIVSETFVSGVMGFTDGLTFSAMPFNSGMNKWELVRKAGGEYISEQLWSFPKNGIQEFILNRII